MKNSKQLKWVLVMLVGLTTGLNAQNVSTRTNEFEVDLSDSKKLVNSTVPVVNWITPVAETNYAQESKYSIKFEIVSSIDIKNITISIKETVEAASRGTQTILPKEDVVGVVARNRGRST